MFTILIAFMIFRPRTPRAGGYPEGIDRSVPAAEALPVSEAQPPTPEPGLRRAISARTSGSRATASARPAAAGPLGKFRSRACAAWWVWLAFFVRCVSLFPLFEQSGYVRLVAFDTILYMLLALGLNIVVGWAACSISGSSRSTGSARTPTHSSTQISSASTCRRSSPCRWWSTSAL